MGPRKEPAPWGRTGKRHGHIDGSTRARERGAKLTAELPKAKFDGEGHRKCHYECS